MITLPFSQEKLFEIFENLELKKLQEHVHVKSSLANLGDKLLTYISNLELDCDFDFKDCTYEEKAQVLEQYANCNSCVKIQSLIDAYLHILATIKNIDGYVSILSNDEAKTFVETHVELCDRLHTFFDSSILWYCDRLKDQDRIADYPAQTYPCIEDKKYIFLSVVYLLSEPSSVMLYSSIDQDRIRYFTYQLNEPMFEGKYLANYLYTENNVFGAMVLTPSE